LPVRTPRRAFYLSDSGGQIRGQHGVVGRLARQLPDGGEPYIGSRSGKSLFFEISPVFLDKRFAQRPPGLHPVPAEKLIQRKAVSPPRVR